MVRLAKHSQAPESTRLFLANLPLANPSKHVGQTRRTHDSAAPHPTRCAVAASRRRAATRRNVTHCGATGRRPV